VQIGLLKGALDFLFGAGQGSAQLATQVLADLGVQLTIIGDND
jgi:hypothetical protein